MRAWLFRHFLYPAPSFQISRSLVAEVLLIGFAGIDSLLQGPFNPRNLPSLQSGSS